MTQLKLFLTSIFILSGMLSLAQSFSWTRPGGGSGADESFCISADGYGNVYTTGYFTGTAAFGSTNLTSSGGMDVFVTKHNPLGSLIWSVKSGGSNDESGHMVAVDGSSGFYVAGEFAISTQLGPFPFVSKGLSDIFLARYDTAGTLLWALKYGGPARDVINSLKVDAQGNVYLTGHFKDSLEIGSTVVLSSGGSDIYAVKFDNLGNLLWITSAGGINDDESRGLAVDASGNVFIGGFFQGNVTFGTTNLASTAGSKDMFLAKLDPFGGFLWAVKGGGAENDGAYELSVNNTGDCYVTGNFKSSATFGVINLQSNGDDDIFIAKYNASGFIQWAKQAGGLLQDKGYAISADPFGMVYITGSFEGPAWFGAVNLTGLGGRDIFVACYDATGTLQWVLQAGGPGFDRGYGMTSNITGSVWLTGIFEQSSNFGSSVLTSAGDKDMFVARLGGLSSIQEIEKNKFTLYPNPVKEGNPFYVKNFGYDEFEVLVFDYSGKLISRELKTDSANNPIATSGMKAGLYSIVLSKGEKTKRSALIVR
jgi:hypothetical protein